MVGIAAILTFQRHRFALAVLAVLAVRAFVELVVESTFPISTVERSIDAFLLLLFLGAGVYTYRTNAPQGDHADR
jgi:predicted transporter